jgi:ABC-type branched-subunit amino acid transport system substrate-binding protein
VQRTMTHALLLLMVLAAGFIAAACTPAEPRPVSVPTASPQPVAPVVIGAILDVGRDAGPDGRQRYEAAMLAVDLVNQRGGLRLPGGARRPLQLALYDDAGRPERAEPALLRLVEDGAVAVIGPSTPAATSAARRAAEGASLPLIALSEMDGDAAGRWHWTFSMMVPPEEALAATIDFLAASGVDRLAWLAPRTMDATILQRALPRLASAARMQIVADERYAPGEEDQTERLARLQKSDPRVILAWPRDANEAAQIARDSAQVRDLVPVFLGPAASDPTTLDLAGDRAATVRTVTLRLPVSDDLWDHDALTPIIRDFRRELRARTGREATSEAAGAWDAVRLLVDTIEYHGTSRAAIRDGLEGTADYRGATGTVSFSEQSHDGLDRRALIVARSEGRRWRLPP